MIVGIVGPSCSGKSTVATEVARSLSAPLVRLDGKWRKGADKPVVNGYRSYERPGLYDSEATLAEMQEAARRSPVVVAEGFLLFAFPALYEACGIRFYIDAPHEELVRRRMARIAAGGDPVWKANGMTEADKGWLAHGREEWEAFGAPQARLPGVQVVDGTKPPGAATAEMLSLIEARLALAPSAAP